MPEVHMPMTGLETCFEEELAKLPGWHSDMDQLDHPQSMEEPRDTEQSKAVEEPMILGT